MLSSSTSAPWNGSVTKSDLKGKKKKAKPQLMSEDSGVQSLTSETIVLHIQMHHSIHCLSIYNKKKNMNSAVIVTAEFMF